MPTPTSNNIISFPKKDKEKSYDLPSTKEEATEKIVDFKEDYINGGLEMVVPIVFDNLHMLGFVSPDEDNDKIGALIVETIRAYMCNKYNIPHPFQQVAEAVFEKDDDGDIILNKNMDIIFRKHNKKKE